VSAATAIQERPVGTRAVVEPSRKPAADPTRRRRPGDWPLSLLAVAVPLLVGALRLGLTLDRPFTSGGDVAFIELAVRQVLHGGVALGPYSRFGWHHPGPSLFYLFAPVYWLSGGSSRALFLNSWLLNGACLLGTVWIVRARVGETVARLAAVVVGVYVGAVGFTALINPWNPSLLAAPIILMLVAAAAAATGSTWSLVTVVVTGSYLVQTHLGTMPVTALAVVVAVVGWSWQVVVRRRSRRFPEGRSRRDAVTPRALAVPLVVGAALVMLVWVGPVVQEFTQRDGNLTQISDFYRHPPGSVVPKSHSADDAFAAVSNFATTVPLGNVADLDGHRLRLLVAGAIGVVGVLVGIAGWRRARFVAWLGLLSTGALLVAVVAGTRVIGALYPYLFDWTKGLGLPAMVGAAALAWTFASRRMRAWLPDGLRWRGAVAWLGVAAMVVLAGLVTRTVVHPPSTSYVDSPDARAVAARIEALVGHDRTRVFQVRVVAQQFSDGPVLLALAKAGYRFRLTRTMDLYQGTSEGLGGPIFELRPATVAAPSVPGTIAVTIGQLNLRMLPAAR
jgi:hypothetical protein